MRKTGIHKVTYNSIHEPYKKTSQTFEEKHPGVWPGVNKFEVLDSNGGIKELWIRDKNGVMVDVTEKYLLGREIARLESEVQDD
jgi:hypothetical protein